MAEKRLGRGLDYLLSRTKDTETQKEPLKVQSISILSIKTNRFQPRSSINEETLKELMDSINENGVLQPILVRKEGNSFELIAGERRYRACLALDMDTIPAIVLDVPDNKLLQLALIENIQRENLNPMEEANAYKLLLDLENITHDELARRVGKKRSTITNMLRLLDLPEEIQDDVSRGTLTPGHARSLLSISSKDQMIEIAERIKKDGLSVREVEKLSKVKDPSKTPVDNEKEGDAHNILPDNNLSDFERSLCDEYGTKVEIVQKGEKGKISFTFYSNDDFMRLYLLLSKGDNNAIKNPPRS